MTPLAAFLDAADRPSSPAFAAEFWKDRHDKALSLLRAFVC